MDVDDSGDGGEVVDEESSDKDSEDEETEDTSDIAMVPMADILNARYDSVNVSHVDMKISVAVFLSLRLHGIDAAPRRLNSSTRSTIFTWLPRSPSMLENK
jgi:hypothetical protein